MPRKNSRQSNTDSHRTSWSGFTLIEVLFGVIILGLGLLGLGAVIPGVITQQRNANEQTLAVNALNDAERALTSNPALWSVYVTDNTGVGAQGFGRQLLDQSWSEYREWDTTNNDVVTTTGTLTFPSALVMLGDDEQAIFSQVDRLWPKPPNEHDHPLFVWDVVCRRTTPADPLLRVGPHRMQLAVFLRRLDPSIRLSSGFQYTLVEALDQAASVPSADYRVAVAADNVGLPTYRGIGPSNLLRYSTPIALDVLYDARRRDRIVLLDSQSDPTITPEMVSAIGVINQLVVDNLGHVYRVKKATNPAGDSPVAGSNIVLFVDPPVDAGVEDSDPTDPNTIFQIVATAQKPVGVRVVDMVVQDEVVTYGTGSGVR